jgi:UDP-N-acetylglucosamine--N-acetylmuramyl-(pentapeptide) pyrophosphoryl-undecaprenol N-acetylglucosamine transferase
LRQDLVRRDREEALKAFGLDGRLPTLAVVGGSQGADALNRSVVEALNGTASKLQVIHVSGRGKAAEVEAAYAAKGARAVVREFVNEMDALYSAADLVVSRAGAMAIAELAAFGVPAVLVPIPRSAADHQRENARAAARSGGAILVEEAAGAAGLAPVLERLAARDPGIGAMRERIGATARAGAAEAILDDLRREVLR